MPVHTPHLTRRRFLEATGAGLVLAAGAPTLFRADTGALGEAHRKALAASQLVYVSPLKKDGAESTCHGEVWFVSDGDDVLVVTDATRWKATSIQKGLGRARLWIGDHGVWTKSDAFKQSPSFDAAASFESQGHPAALEKFGTRYPDGWDKWGPRFKDGLADGSRVLIRYRPA